MCDLMYRDRHGKDKVILPSEELEEIARQEIMEERKNDPILVDYDFDDEWEDDYDYYSSDE